MPRANIVPFIHTPGGRHPPKIWGVMPSSFAPELVELFELVQKMPLEDGGTLQPTTPRRIVKGTSFFPGGTGLWGAPQNRCFPSGGYMVLGSTFDNPAGYANLLKHGAEIEPIDRPPGYRGRPGPTWRNLAALLFEARINPANCWFTNVYPALLCRRDGRNTGSAGVRAGSDVDRWCQAFFERSVELMQPRLILPLGRDPIRFVGRVGAIPSWRSGQIGHIDSAGTPIVRIRVAGHRTVAVALVHPSLRYANMHRRQLPARCGHDIEADLLHRALRRAASGSSTR